MDVVEIIRINLFSADVAERILQHLADTYFADYAIVAYAIDAMVVRPEKYA